MIKLYSLSSRQKNGGSIWINNTSNDQKLPKSSQKRILEKLDFYIQSNKPLKFAKPLQSREFGEFRFRIGDYRIIFDFDSDKKIIIIVAIGHRKNIYK